MSAPRCTVCNDSGSMSRWIGGDLDCTVCDTAAGRATLNAQIEAAKREAAEEYRLAAFDPVWLAYQLGKAAVPVAAKPSEVVQDGLPWAIAEFWSSANPGRKVRMLAEGDAEIKAWGKRGDFIRWVYPASPVAAGSAAPAGEVERDAARYRWLRAHAGIKPTTAEIVVSDPLAWTDAAVDSMMKGGE